MIPKMPAPAKAGVADFSDKIMRKKQHDPENAYPREGGVADFSDKIMRKIKENRERRRFNLIEKRSSPTFSTRSAFRRFWWFVEAKKRVTSMVGDRKSSVV